MRRIVVIGGRGFFGAAAVELLRREGEHVGAARFLRLGLAVIDEMHDRQIVASALVLQDKGAAVAILTRDSVIQSSGLVTVIW